MDSINPEFALYGSKNKGARTDTVFFPMSEVGTRGVDPLKFPNLCQTFLHIWDAVNFAYLLIYLPNLFSLNGP